MGGTPNQHSTHVDPARRRARWLGVVAGLAALTLIAIMTVRALGPGPVDPREETAGGVVGLPGGAIVTPVPTPSPTATAEPSPPPTSSAPVATSTPVPAPQPTPSPTAAAPVATPQPPAPAPTATPVVVAVAGPEDTVALFYRRVTDGSFDAAYDLWSDRMKATYTRPENLDERFAQTSEIRFDALSVAERSATTAVVQANFTEFYDTGASRQFVGYWELVLVGNRWLLDVPHY